MLSIISCTSPEELASYGKLSPINPGNKKSFAFAVSEKFINTDKKAKMDEEHPLITKSEGKLLKKLLKYNKFCLDKSDNPYFVIVSKQERVFDTTFAHVVDGKYDNYSTKPLSPRTYYGTCLSNHNYVR